MGQLGHIMGRARSYLSLANTVSIQLVVMARTLMTI